jgi:DNA repair exonuclease SbcCD nuclease subunit
VNSFRFLHAADLHLDSPLLGLARKSHDFASRVEDASRAAFDGLIELAIGERCAFVVIAGDLFDGQWRDYRTGIYFLERMRRLKEAGIRAYFILGNHDAENKFAGRLDYAANSRLLSARRPESVRVEGLDAVIHGRSFPQRDVSDNIALDYPPPVPGCFNIGLLHTSCTGRDGHALYAPCTVEQLVNHGYDYWALGHVHTREILHEDPYILYSGNLQGRNPRETGPKGATLVTVEDGRVTSLEARDLDPIRWAFEAIGISGYSELEIFYSIVKERIQRARGDGSRGLALRLQINGSGPLHADLVTLGSGLREEIETLAANISDEIWIEKVELKTSPPATHAAADPTVSGRLRVICEAYSRSPEFQKKLEKYLHEIDAKFPASARASDLIAALRADSPARALSLALALLD